MDNLNKSGDLYLTHTRLADRFVLRFCVGQTNTEARHVERDWQRICRRGFQVVGFATPSLEIY